MLADLRQENAGAAAKVLSDAGFDVARARTRKIDRGEMGVSPSFVLAGVPREMLNQIVPARRARGKRDCTTCPLTLEYV